MVSSLLKLIGPPTWCHAAGELRFAAERPFQLMAVLAHRADWLPRERLAALFWPAHDADAARRNLRKVLYRLRDLAALPQPEEHAGALRWRVPTDLHALDAALAAGDVAAVARSWRAEPFDGLGGDDAFDEWLVFERQRLRTRWRQALLHGAATVADATLALDWASLLREHDPLDEEALRAQLAALQRGGRHSDARAAYQAFEAVLASELAARPDAHTRALAAQLGARTETVWPTSALPPPAAPLIGRELESRQLAEALAAPGARWLTLLGPGGIGKTRLARAVADVRGEGAAVVALHEVADLQSLPARISQALGLGMAAWRWEGLAHTLATRSLLLVLDGADSLAGLAAPMDTLLQAASGVQVLATSRQRVGARGERLLVLAGLPCPEPEDDDRVLDFDAARLFTEAARRHAGDFDPARDPQALGALCRAVEGWPLALELCAAWTPHLALGEIAAELQQGQGEVLRSPNDGGDDLQAVLQSSWQRLGAPEREAAARLSLLDGPCSTETARAVAGAPLVRLAALADRAWLRREPAPPGGDPAAGLWALHALLQRFLRRQLEQMPDWRQAAVEALAASMSRRAGVCPPRREVGASRAALRTLRPDLGAMVQAWRLSLHAGRGERLDLLLDPLFELLAERHDWAGATALLSPAGQTLQGRPRARLLAVLALLRMHGGEHDAGTALARDALRVLRRGPQDDSLLRALFTLGQGLMLGTRLAAAERVLAEGRALARQLGDVLTESHLLDVWSSVAHARGDHARQVAMLEEAIALSLSQDEPPLISYSNLGNALRAMDCLDQAQAAYERGLALAGGTRYRSERGMLLLNLGLLLESRRRPGDLDRAADCARQGLQAVAGGIDPRAELHLLGLEAQVQVHQGQLAAAAASLRRALAAARRLGLRASQLWLLLKWAQWLHASGRPDEAFGVLGTVTAASECTAYDAARVQQLRRAWGVDGDGDADPREAAGRQRSPDALVDHLLARP